VIRVEPDEYIPHLLVTVSTEHGGTKAYTTCHPDNAKVVGENLLKQVKHKGEQP
jgi:hypothetical protein